MIMLPMQSVQAGMIDTQQTHSPASLQVDRDVVIGFLSRAQTVSELQTLGVDAQSARDRVASMTDGEVSSLAGKINAMPAGADGGGILLVVVLVFVIWYFAFRR
jgi:hypothetical protein